MKNATLINMEIMEVIRAYDHKSSVLFLHSFHVAAIMQILAVNLGVISRDKNQSYFWTVGLLHDLGKLDMPKDILLKPGPLTASEMVIMQEHPTDSLNRLMKIEPFVRYSDAALSHHEKGDGSGYPRGLRAHQMTLEAKMVSTVDRFEAMTAEGREYRPNGMPLAQVMPMLAPDIRLFFGSQYGVVVNTLLDYHRNNRIQKAGWGENRTTLDTYTSLPRAVNS